MKPDDFDEYIFSDDGDAQLIGFQMIISSGYIKSLNWSELMKFEYKLKDCKTVYTYFVIYKRLLPKINNQFQKLYKKHINKIKYNKNDSSAGNM